MSVSRGKFIAALTLILSLARVNAFAMGPATGAGNVNPEITPEQAADYYRADKFQFSNYNDDLHLMLGYGGALTIGLILEHQFGMKRWQAALIGASVAVLFGVAKETLHDNYCSRTDILTWSAGGLAAGLTMTVFQF